MRHLWYDDTGFLVPRYANSWSSKLAILDPSGPIFLAALCGSIIVVVAVFLFTSVFGLSSDV
jgi:hypothetical protein